MRMSASAAASTTLGMATTFSEIQKKNQVKLVKDARLGLDWLG